MCLTPKISLTTAITEFIVAFFVFFKYNRRRTTKLLALFLFLLGFYQFTEFMLCRTGNIEFWGVVGFITYTFLPSTGLALTLVCMGKRPKNFLLHIAPIIFSVIAITSENFVIGGGCSKYFLTIKTLFTSFGAHFVLALFYLVYYFGYIILILLMFARELKIEKNTTKRRIYLFYILGIIFSLFPALLLITVFPSLNIVFPSMYCQFALLFSIVAIFTASLDNKINS